jgi:hypothetical protein
MLRALLLRDTDLQQAPTVFVQDDDARSAFIANNVPRVPSSGQRLRYPFFR